MQTDARDGRAPSHAGRVCGMAGCHGMQAECAGWQGASAGPAGALPQGLQHGGARQCVRGRDAKVSLVHRMEHMLSLGVIVCVRASRTQVIDGQQRLTTLLIILSCVMDWARRQGNSVLEQRVRRMVYLEADPLDPHSEGRFRCVLHCAVRCVRACVCCACCAMLSWVVCSQCLHVLNCPRVHAHVGVFAWQLVDVGQAFDGAGVSYHHQASNQWVYQSLSSSVCSISHRSPKYPYAHRILV